MRRRSFRRLFVRRDCAKQVLWVGPHSLALALAVKTVPGRKAFSRRFSVCSGTPKNLIRAPGSGDSKLRLTSSRSSPVTRLLGRGAITIHSKKSLLSCPFVSGNPGTPTCRQSRLEARGAWRIDPLRADLPSQDELPTRCVCWIFRSARPLPGSVMPHGSRAGSRVESFRTLPCC